jgi:hypothetical protein
MAITVSWGLPEETLKEQYKFIDIKGFEGLYAINKAGQVISYTNDKHKKDKVLKQDNSSLYARVALTKDNQRKKYCVHRLLAETFIPNPNNYPVVNHLNGKKEDNSLENLEWCSYSENTKHAFKIGLMTNQKRAVKFTGINKRAISYADAEKIRNKYNNEKTSHRKLGELYGVSHRAIQQILNYDTYKIKGVNYD